MYVDEERYVMRNSSGDGGLDRYGSRRELDECIGSGRYALDEDAEPFGVAGTISQVLKRAAEYENDGGRKAEHHAEGLREATDILRGTTEDDDYEKVKFEDLDAIGDKGAENLRDKGIVTRRDVRTASDEEILATSWVGDEGLRSIRREVRPA